MIAQGRKKLLQQVTVSGVYLNDAEPCITGANGGSGKRSDNLLDLSDRQRRGGRLIRAERNRARGNRLPAALGWRNLPVPFPWPGRAGLASRVGKLNPRNRSLLADES